MSKFSVSAIFIVSTLVLSVSSITVDDSITKIPLVFADWSRMQQSGKPQSFRQQMLFDLRSTGRVTPNLVMKRLPSSPPLYFMRPMKYAPIKKGQIPMQSQYKFNKVTPPRYKYRKSAPNVGEYAFENPFLNAAYVPNKKDEMKYSPIQTVPAPNLDSNLMYSTNQDYTHDPVDNHLMDKDQHQQYTYRPLHVHQYQVTEQTNDHSVRDLITGKPKSPTGEKMELFGQPGALETKAVPIEISFAGAQSQNAPVSVPLLHLSNPIQQQQLPDTYALPIGTQPQLQQHILQQQSILQGVPVSVYNPTYLVSQSNNLLKHHREQLFKPAPAFLGTINQPTIDMALQSLNDVNSVASPGQIQSSIQSQQRQSQQQSNLATVIPNYDGPTFQRFIGDKPPTASINSIIFGQSAANVNEIQQSQLTEAELNSLMNIDNPPNANNQIVFPTYYPTQSELLVELENRQRQHLNDLTISKANEELKAQREIVTTSTESPYRQRNNRKKTAYVEHQEKLAEQLSGKTSLRIFVPDEDYRKQNEIRRSSSVLKVVAPEEDSWHGKSSLDESDRYSRDDDNYEITTEDDDDDNDNFAHDGESVDRLVLDGETKEPISTIESYSF